MSETLEERLRDRAKKDPDYLITAYASDVIEVIDGLRAENAKLWAELLKAATTLHMKGDITLHPGAFDTCPHTICAAYRATLKESESK